MSEEKKYKHEFSIIIPCYNVEKYLCQCVDSVLAQTFVDYEIILVDDGSPDACPAICDEYSDKSDKVRVIHKLNGGLSDARNAGLDVARGKYVIFLDSDDWWDDKDALRKINDSIKESGADITIIGMKKYFSQDNIYGGERIPNKIIEQTISLNKKRAIQHYLQSNSFVACAWDKIVRREFIEHNHKRFVKDQFSEDIEWCCKLLMDNPKIEVMEDVICVYRQQVSTSISANVGTKNIMDILDVFSRFADKEKPLPVLHFMANQYVLLITNLMRLNKKDRKPLEAEVKKYWWLLDYNWCPYTHMVSKVKLLGYNVVKKLLRICYKTKHKDVTGKNS